MDKILLSNLSAEVESLQKQKEEISSRFKAIAMHVLRDHFHGECTFVTEEQIEEEDFGGCPAVASMCFGDDIADAWITKMRIDGRGELLLDMFAYYKQDTRENIDANYEHLDWEEVAGCLLAAAQDEDNN